jgi:hypothetical protein
VSGTDADGLAAFRGLAKTKCTPALMAAHQFQSGAFALQLMDFTKPTSDRILSFAVQGNRRARDSDAPEASRRLRREMWPRDAA